MTLSLRHQEEAAVRLENVLEDRFVGKVKRVTALLEKDRRISGWCICPDPHMIVQKGICIQSGIRPTLPPKQPSHPATPTLPAYQTAAPIPTYRPKVA